MSLAELVALFLAVCALVLYPEPQELSLNELVALQKEHDLLKVWGKTQDFGEETLVQDFGLVFPNKSGFVEINGKKIWVGEEKQESEAVVAEGRVFDAMLNLVELRIGVFS